MVFNLQFYLQRGLLAAPLENAERKRYIQETCAEFVDFMDEYVFDGYSSVYFKALLSNFIDNNKEYNKLTPKRWGMWMNSFINYDSREWTTAKDRGGYYLKLLSN